MASDKSSTQAASAPLPLASLTALGVVFGDLGTSPLYTLQTVLGATGGKVDAAAALGVLSLIIWTLIVTISVKYCLFVMRADNHGEGGILALMSLDGFRDWKRGAFVGAAMGLMGAALIYGDGVITPAISVLSAVEGVKVATPALERFVLPLTLAILISLFAVQRFGTGRIGRAFGPVMLVWFVCIGGLGLVQVLRHPAVLQALDPLLGARFLVRSGPRALPILGGVFLCATGGEALYADMGHVGKRPIRLAWYLVVLPALLLSYAGQSAALMDHGAASGNPFFLLAPSWGVYPLVFIATLATIIASQAIVTGAFSMTRQAIQLGWLPLLNIKQTSKTAYGQIYVPVVNWLMMAATVGVVLAFRSSDHLSGAYGTAVSTTMLLTTFLLAYAMGRVWRWPIAAVVAVTAVFAVVDVAFFSANLLKIADGGYVPLCLAAAIFVVMLTWRQGMQKIVAALHERSEPMEAFVDRLKSEQVIRTPGVKAFLTKFCDNTPPLMATYLRVNGVLPETAVALSIHTLETPHSRPGERADFEEVGEGLWRVDLRFGFMETPDLGGGLSSLERFGDKVDMDEAWFFGTRDFVTRSEHPSMAAWRTALFAFLYRNGMRMTDRFNLPPERTVEVAREIEI